MGKWAWEAAHAPAVRLAWDAAGRAKRQAVIDAMARYRAQHSPKAKPPEHDAPITLEEALPEGAAEGRVPQPGTPKPDGSFVPFRGRGLWGNEHAR